MRNWGIVVTAFYAIVLSLLTPGVFVAALPDWRFQLYVGSFEFWGFWLWLAILVGGEAILLFLSVDTSAKRLRPRQHILLSAATVALLVALLLQAAAYSILAALLRENHPYWEYLLGNDWPTNALALLLALWLVWTLIFYVYARGKSTAATRIVGWLLKGSVLELLIAIPCHVIVRRRGDCSAPMLTGYGIATGLAIMLLSFGPSVLFLFKRRLEQYRKTSLSRAV
jgi:hypothetical protein